MPTGVLIAESLRVGGVFEGVPLEVTGMRRIEVPAPAGGQPGRWTLLDFRAPEGAAEPLAAALAGCLAPTGGWYVNYSTGSETFVVFAGRVFRYPRGDAAARAEVEEYARGVGVPEAQLDWVD